MEGDRVVGIGSGGFNKLLCDLTLRIAENDAGLTNRPQDAADLVPAQVGSESSAVTSSALFPFRR